jgi:murein L,D-transpeptidase YcbB/YkuD
MRFTRAHLRALTAAVLMLTPCVSLKAQHADAVGVAAELKWRVERLRTRGTLRIGEAVVPSRVLTLDAYEQRGFTPLWTDAHAMASLLAAIESVRGDGLDPEHYHLTALARADRRAGDASLVADWDLVATDAFVRLSRDLFFGKVEPEGPASGADAGWAFGGSDAVASLARVAATGQLHEAIGELRPKHFVYRGLVAALADLRRVASEGGWEPLPAGPSLARDSAGVRVLLLRRRLRQSGDLGAEEDPRSPRFDSVLEAAVRSFQHRHGLNEGGVVDSATLAALNVPVEQRIEQVRVNLERARWVAHELPDTFVAVNVAGARVYLLAGETVAFETRAIVGTGFTQTPIFSAPMLYIDLNPMWTVPAGIVEEVLEAVRSDPGHLERQGMRVLDESGQEVDPGDIDFQRYTAADFPYVLRQDPGPANTLGRIKLMLPNEHQIYLHDTPTRGLFAEEERLFSHGCVRIEDPVGLAELVLGDTVRWSRATLQEAIDAGETLTIPLLKPVDVFVLYWTAAVDTRGELHFHRDVYHRDAAVLTALDAEPSGAAPEGSAP